MIIAFAGVRVFEPDTAGPGKTIANASIWNGSEEIDSLMSEVQEIADTMRAIRLDQADDYEAESFEQLEIDEMEALASGTDFWKGF